MLPQSLRACDAHQCIFLLNLFLLYIQEALVGGVGTEHKEEAQGASGEGVRDGAEARTHSLEGGHEEVGAPDGNRKQSVGEQMGRDAPEHGGGEDGKQVVQPILGGVARRQGRGLVHDLLGLPRLPVSRGRNRGCLEGEGAGLLVVVEEHSAAKNPVLALVGRDSVALKGEPCPVSHALRYES